MSREWILAAALGAAALFTGCSREDSAGAGGEPPAAEPPIALETEWRQPLFEGLGDIHFPITTSSQTAQHYFDQGLSLAWAFNHAAADFAFNEAALHDPDCAMCYWGSALVLGPNVNAAMDPANAPRAHLLAEKARQLAASATPREQALTAALASRYQAAAPADRSALDQAYADAMREVAAQFPEDPHVLALTAEALMDLHPWDFFVFDGEARPWTAEILQVLEQALARNADHIGAIHLYIHAVEQSSEASRAEPYADKLADLAPLAGHLVHMPAHIYIRVGRYHDSTLNNMKAADADAQFVAVCRSNSPIYLAGYIPHNWHFGWITAAIEGWSEQAFVMAEGTASRLTPELLRSEAVAVAQHFLMQPAFAQIRFAAWDDVLAAPAPDADLLYARAVWRYARGRALLGKGDVDGAAAEADALAALQREPGLEAMRFFETQPANSLLDIAALVLEGEISAARGQLAAATDSLSRAVALEDGLPYNEPPFWFHPVRHSLGAVQLAAGDAAGAEATYRQDLAIMRDNGWALLGLSQALQAQGRSAEAQAARARFDAAWQHADVQITSSRL